MQAMSISSLSFYLSEVTFQAIVTLQSDILCNEVITRQLLHRLRLLTGISASLTLGGNRTSKQPIVLRRRVHPTYRGERPSLDNNRYFVRDSKSWFPSRIGTGAKRQS